MLPQIRHRDDIQGMRAIAVLLVALNHAGVGFLGGGYVGVDVFFVLSGFLITGVLLSDADKRGRVSIANFYVRRARRILPAATLTLVVTDVFAYKLLNVVRAKEVFHDSLWSAFFGANIHFAREGTDYFAQGAAAHSPMQHFWSLAVEEQFYVVWPAIVAMALFGGGFAVLARGYRSAVGERDLRRLLVVVLAIAAWSLYVSVHQTALRPAAAYFSTTARGWELALGAVLAVAAGWAARLPGGVRAGLGWTGLACIAAAAVLFGRGTPFPGSAALLPTVGAVMLLAAGIGERRPAGGPGRLLAAAPLRYVGDRSYTFYLWHWPVLILAQEHHGSKLPVAVNLLLLALAFAISVVTYRWYENPLRRLEWNPPRAALLLWPASLVAVGLVCTFGLDRIDAKLLREQTAAAAVSVPVDVAAEVRATSQGRPTPAVQASVKAALAGRPLPAFAPPASGIAQDRYVLPAGCAAGFGPHTTSRVCAFGDTASRRTMVVLGDSHAQMWVPTLQAVAQRERLALRPIVKQGCVAAKWSGVQRDAACRAWYAWALKTVAALRPSVLVVSPEYLDGADIDAVRVGTQRAIDDVTKRMRGVAGHVVVMGDVPGLDKDPVDCLLAHKATMKTCTFALAPAKTALLDTVRSTAESNGARFLDTLGWFCADGQCPAVIGHTVAYLDINHVTTTYARQIQPAFLAAFRKALGGAPARP